MSDIESLEQYFDILLSQENENDEDHPLADESERFLLFDDVRVKFSHVSGHMGKMSPLVKQGYSQYLQTIHQLQLSFHSLSGIEDEELDHYLRTLAVERLVYKSEQVGQRKTSEMLGYMAEGLMLLFFDEGEELSQLTRETMEGLSQFEQGSQLPEAQEQQLQQIIMLTLGEYESIEDALSSAKQGIMAKDKKMMKILRSVKIGMGKGLVQTAIARTHRDQEASRLGAGQGQSITSEASRVEPGNIFSDMSKMSR
jgi:hypothetical protein